jgi:glycerophosphoryl diester phosphodiesterase
MKIIAHRGDHTREIENTIKALLLARQIGFDGIETDVRLTKDHQIMVCHDDSLQRCFGEDVLLSQLTFAEAKSFGVPSLEDLFLALPQDFEIHLELKSRGSAKILLENYRGKISKRQKNLYITSFWHEELKIIKSQMPEIMVGAIIVGRPVWPLPINICEACGARALIMRSELCDKDFVRVMKNSGFEVNAWRIETCKDITHAKSIGLDLIYSDVPTDDNLKKILKKS